MSMDVTQQGVFISLDLGDIKRSAQAREELKNREPGSEADGERKERRSAQTPSFLQSYTGKGFLLDVIA